MGAAVMGVVQAVVRGVEAQCRAAGPSIVGQCGHGVLSMARIHKLWVVDRKVRVARAMETERRVRQGCDPLTRAFVAWLLDHGRVLKRRELARHLLRGDGCWWQQCVQGVQGWERVAVGGRGAVLGRELGFLPARVAVEFDETQGQFFGRILAREILLGNAQLVGNHVVRGAALDGMVGSDFFPSRGEKHCLGPVGTTLAWHGEVHGLVRDALTASTRQWGLGALVFLAGPAGEGIGLVLCAAWDG